MVSLTDLAGVSYAPTGADDSLATGPMTALAMQRIKPGFWQNGGDSHKWAGILSDVLAGAQGKPGTYAQTLADNQERDLKSLLVQTQLAKAMQPEAPHYFEANNGDQGSIDASGKVNILYHDPTPKTTYITADNADGTKTVIPVIGGVPQMGGQPQPQQSGGSASLPSGFTIRKAGAGSGQPGFR